MKSAQKNYYSTHKMNSLIKKLNDSSKTANNNYNFFNIFGIGMKLNLRGKLAKKELISMLKSLFDRYYLHLSRELSYSVLSLSTLGFKFSVKDSEITIEFAPYSERLEIPLNLFSEVELLNLLDLARLTFKFGGILTIGKINIPDRINKPIIRIILSEKVVEIEKCCKMHLSAIDPWTFTETFVLKIHDIWNLDGKTILDIGAEVGDTSLFYASKRASVYAVEPVHFNLLNKNIEINREYKINTANLAMGNQSSLKFWFDDLIVDGSASAYIHKSHKKFVETKTLPLAKIIEYFGLKSIDYLKSDSKGGEFSITETDLAMINLGFLIEYTTENPKQLKTLIEIIKNAKFDYRIFNHNPISDEDVFHHGTIVGWRQ